MNVLGDKVWKKDWAVGCDDECQVIESRGNLPQTRLLVSQSGITEAVRIDVDVPDGLLRRPHPDDGADLDQPGDVRRRVQAVLQAGGPRALTDPSSVEPVRGRAPACGHLRARWRSRSRLDSLRAHPRAARSPADGTPVRDRRPHRRPDRDPQGGPAVRREGDPPGRHRARAQGRVPDRDRRGPQGARALRADDPRGVRRPRRVAADLRAGRGGDRPRLDERQRHHQHPLHRRLHAAPARHRRAEAEVPAADGHR